MDGGRVAAYPIDWRDAGRLRGDGEACGSGNLSDFGDSVHLTSCGATRAANLENIRAAVRGIADELATNPARKPDSRVACSCDGSNVVGGAKALIA